MSPPLLQTYADAVSAQAAPLNNCFGFIDGTVRPICRPVELQEVVYNGRRMILELKSLREEMHVHFEDLPYFDLGKHSTEDSADFELEIKNQEGKQAQAVSMKKNPDNSN